MKRGSHSLLFQALFLATGLPSVLMLIRRAVECRAFVLERILVGLRWHSEQAVVSLGFPTSVQEKKS